MANSYSEEYIIQQLHNKKTVGKEIVVTLSKYCQECENQTVCISSHPREHFSEYHTHAFFEINYIHRGRGINLVENEIIHMSEGDILIMHPGTFHTLYMDDQSVIYNFIVEKEWFCAEFDKILPSDAPIYGFFEKISNDDYYKYVFCPRSEGENRIVEAAEKLIDRLLSDSSCRYIICESVLIELIASLIEEAKIVHLSKIKSSKDSKLINILMYIAENYSTVTLEELSEKYFYSKTHICRLFSENTGKSFNQTLMQMKINHACKFLKDTDMSVEEIAHEVGYDSVEYFQRLFKKKIGITPGEFRKYGNADTILC